MIDNVQFEEMLGSLRGKVLPKPCLLPPWLMCHALGLEYVAGGNYHIRRYSEDGTRFSFGTLSTPTQYSGEDKGVNALRVINVSQKLHERDVEQGLYPSYVEVNMDGTDMTPEQIAIRDKELEGKLQ